MKTWMATELKTEKKNLKSVQCCAGKCLTTGSPE